MPIKAGQQDAPLMFCNLAKAFKHYYIFGFHLPEVIKTITVIHYCYCLMVSGNWRQIIYWKADYITPKLYLKEADFNVYILLWHSELSKICALIYRNLPCPQKFLAMQLIPKYWKIDWFSFPIINIFWSFETKFVCCYHDNKIKLGQLST